MEALNAKRMEEYPSTDTKMAIEGAIRQYIRSCHCNELGKNEKQDHFPQAGLAERGGGSVDQQFLAVIATVSVY